MHIVKKPTKKSLTYKSKNTLHIPEGTSTVAEYIARFHVLNNLIPCEHIFEEPSHDSHLLRNS